MADDYGIASAGFGNVPICLKWMLCFEEPETRTLWLAKATPRDWLVHGGAPLLASSLSTRYGRVAFSLVVSSGSNAPYTVRANVTLPPAFVAGSDQEHAPAGGVRLRIRAPPEVAGKLSSVSVGGRAWDHFNAAEETIDFPAATLSAAFIETSLQLIVATFAGDAVPLRRARVSSAQRITTTPPASAVPRRRSSAVPAATTASRAAVKCPDGTAPADSFEINGTAWAACEDVQAPNGALVLVSSRGENHWFSKGYEPYGTNWTDH